MRSHGYERRKQRAGAARLPRPAHPRPRPGARRRATSAHDFQRRFRYLLVDEFQDTDPLQAELLLLLAADESRPAGATVRLPVRRARSSSSAIRSSRSTGSAALTSASTAQICEQLVAAGAARVVLQTSFRSVPAIQRFVNAAFSALMTGDAASLQADYVELQPDRADHPAQPAVVALPVPRP